MSLLSGLFTELEKVPAPRFAVSENVARPDRVPAAQLEQRQQPSSERSPRTSTPVYGHLPTLGEDPDQSRPFIQTAATSSPEWLAARDAIYHHLMLCRSCYAPTGRHCPAGAELRQRYDQTPMVNDGKPSRSELETPLTPALTPPRGKRDASPQRSRAQ